MYPRAISPISPHKQFLIESSLLTPESSITGRTEPQNSSEPISRLSEDTQLMKTPTQYTLILPKDSGHILVSKNATSTEAGYQGSASIENLDENISRAQSSPNGSQSTITLSAISQLIAYSIPGETPASVMNALKMINGRDASKIVFVYKKTGLRTDSGPQGSIEAIEDNDILKAHASSVDGSEPTSSPTITGLSLLPNVDGAHVSLCSQGVQAEPGYNDTSFASSGQKRKAEDDGSAQRAPKQPKLSAETIHMCRVEENKQMREELEQLRDLIISHDNVVKCLERELTSERLIAAEKLAFASGTYAEQVRTLKSEQNLAIQTFESKLQTLVQEREVALAELISCQKQMDSQSVQLEEHRDQLLTLQNQLEEARIFRKKVASRSQAFINCNVALVDGFIKELDRMSDVGESTAGFSLGAKLVQVLDYLKRVVIAY